MAGHLRLVADNSDDGLASADSNIFVTPEDFHVATGRDVALGPPIADGGHAYLKHFSDGASATESVDDFIHGARNSVDYRDTLDGRAIHMQLYSAALNFVKGRIAELKNSWPSRRLYRVSTTGDLDFLTLLGLRLAAGRMACGKKPAEVCRALEIEHNKWSQWENGLYKPDIQILIRFSDIYSVSLDWIYRERTDGLPTDKAENLWTIYNGLVAQQVSTAPSTA